MFDPDYIVQKTEEYLKSLETETVPTTLPIQNEHSINVISKKIESCIKVLEKRLIDSDVDYSFLG